jgi:hypothetical protein
MIADEDAPESPGVFENNNFQKSITELSESTACTIVGPKISSSTARFANLTLKMSQNCNSAVEVLDFDEKDL